MKRFLIVAILSFLITPSVVLGQTITPTLTPSVSRIEAISTNGPVYTSAKLHDRLYIGGKFSQMKLDSSNDQVSRNNLAAVNVSSHQYLYWDPSPNGEVYSLIVDNGKLYVGGNFTHIAGKTRYSLAVFDEPSLTTTDWSPLFNGAIYSMAVDNENLYVGGWFTTANNVVRNHIAVFNKTTGELKNWSAQLNNNVTSIVVTDKVVYVGGDFTQVNNQQRKYIAAFDKNTAQLLPWNPTVTSPVKRISIVNGAVRAEGGSQSNPELTTYDVTLNSQNGSVLSAQTTITPSVPSSLNTNPAAATTEGLMVKTKDLGFKIPTFSDILSFFIRMFFVIAGLAALFYMLLGAFAWVTSSGDKESVQKAQQKITAAVVGLIITVVVLGIVWTLEQVVFKRRICLGLSCPVTIPGLLEPTTP